jgi:hypothetical protein
MRRLRPFSPRVPSLAPTPHGSRGESLGLPRVGSTLTASSAVLMRFPAWLRHFRAFAGPGGSPLKSAQDRPNWDLTAPRNAPRRALVQRDRQIPPVPARVFPWCSHGQPCLSVAGASHLSAEIARVVDTGVASATRNQHELSIQRPALHAACAGVRRPVYTTGRLPPSDACGSFTPNDPLCDERRRQDHEEIIVRRKVIKAIASLGVLAAAVFAALRFWRREP